MNQTYVVKQGDTLWGIRNQFGVSVTELAELNKVDAKSLKVGQVLTIPGDIGINPDNMFMYTVKKGDTLYSIAKVYGTSVSDIKKLNYMSNDNLYVGQVIRIPETYIDYDKVIIPDYINYAVKKGDSLYSIGKKYGVDVSTLMEDNALSSNILKIGQNLKVRVSKSVGVEECFGEEYISDTKYIVKRGDTLYSISKMFNTTVDSIKKKNNLTNNNLNVGQMLII